MLFCPIMQSIHCHLLKTMFLLLDQTLLNLYHYGLGLTTLASKDWRLFDFKLHLPHRQTVLYL